MVARHNRNLLLLASVTVVVVVAAVLSSLSRAPQGDSERRRLFPDLQQNINSVSEVVVSGEGNTVTLVRQDEGWSIAEADGYPATTEKVRSLILNTASLRVLEEKTSTPSLYPRLGVEDPAGEEAESHLLTLNDEAGNSLASLIVGNTQVSGLPSDSPGVYVRRPSAAQSLLVEGRLPVSGRLSEWIDRELFSVAPERIRSVVIRHPGEPAITLDREAGDEEFTLNPVPEDRRPESASVLRQMETLLQDTYINDVTARDGFSFPEDHVRTTVRTFDGLVVRIHTTSRDDTNYVAYDFSVDESASAGTTGSEGPEGEGDSGDEEDLSVADEAARYNDNHSDWVYAIPYYRYQLMVRGFDDLTRPQEEDAQAEG